jgi:hypothetical protein
LQLKVVFSHQKMGCERGDWLGFVFLPGLGQHVRDPAPGLADAGAGMDINGPA